MGVCSAGHLSGSGVAEAERFGEGGWGEAADGDGSDDHQERIWLAELLECGLPRGRDSRSRLPRADRPGSGAVSRLGGTTR